MVDPYSSPDYTHVDNGDLSLNITQKSSYSHCGSSPIHTCCMTFAQWVRGGPQPTKDTTHLTSFILAASPSLSLSLALFPLSLSCSLALLLTHFLRVMISSEFGTLTFSGLVWFNPAPDNTEGDKSAPGKIPKFLQKNTHCHFRDMFNKKRNEILFDTRSFHLQMLPFCKIRGECMIPIIFQSEFNLLHRKLCV